jgi:uncharacterized protein (DUF4415 family)
MYDDKLKPHEDLEIRAFEESLFRSVDQAARGEFAATHTPEQIIARRGRPIGSTKPDTKQQTTIRFDRDLLVALRATGKGWQVRVNEMLRREVLGTGRRAVALAA